MWTSGQKEKGLARQGLARDITNRSASYCGTENPRVGGSTPSPGTTSPLVISSVPTASAAWRSQARDTD
jgi:hypothetical protein